MAVAKSLHSICRWTFNPSKGGFVPAGMGPEWGYDKLGPIDVIKLVKGKITPRMHDHLELGIEMHYDVEVDEKRAPEIVAALIDLGFHVEKISSGVPCHLAHCGPRFLGEDREKGRHDMSERKKGTAYWALKKIWHPNAKFIAVGFCFGMLILRMIFPNLIFDEISFWLLGIALFFMFIPENVEKLLDRIRKFKTKILEIELDKEREKVGINKMNKTN